ncbi:MAG: efflux RND transporter permease subunit, partial [Candidatus Aminicenantaceae bacterium]
YDVIPRIRFFVPEDFRVNPFLQYTISGDYTLHKLRELVKDKLEIGIGSIKGIASIEVTGGADPEIQILLDENKLKALSIHPYAISNALRQRLRTYPAGTVTKGSQEFIFKISDPVGGIRELGDIVVARSGTNPVKLKDVAEILPSFKDIYSINRINGQPTIRMTITKEKGMSTLKVARTAKKKLEVIQQDLPPDLIFRVVDDESKEIQENLNEIYLLVGIITIVIFILVFIVLRSFQPSLLILSSIVFSVLITFNLIYLFKVSINILTLGGLALGFGLFVDNSIVVFENILRLRERGIPPIQAAIQGSKEVFLPVLAATLTTMSVFFSFAYFQGRLKIYYLPLAIVITSALAASLLVSFSLIPAMSPKLIKKRRKKIEKPPRDTYEKVMKVFIRHPLEVVLVVGLIFLGAYKWFKSEVTIGPFFSSGLRQELSVRIGMPAGTPIERTDEVTQKFEKKVLEGTYEKEMNTSIMSDRAYLRIKFPSEIEYSYRPYLLKEELIQLATNFAGINISISGFDPQGYYSRVSSGPYLGSSIKFYGYNLKKLKEITSNLDRDLKRNPRIKESRITSSRYSWGNLDSFEYVLKLDREAMRQYNLDPSFLYYHIGTLIAGRAFSMMRTKIGGKEIDLSIKFPESAWIDMKNLQDSLIQTQGGEYVRLGEISSITENPIASSIDRENQQFQQTLMWEFRGPYKAADRYRQTVFDKLQLPPGFSAKIDDDFFMTEEEKSQLTFSMIFALVIIFMILASLYESIIQPFFILLAVPLSLIGVFIAFVLADFPFDSSAYIGVILLGGIVVNNSILLVDHINLKRKEGLPLLDAVLKGARERIRPIFLTTSTTVLGMLPLVLIQIETGRRRIWSSLALSAVGGLISSTIFILIIIPIFYYYGDNIQSRVKEKMSVLVKAWKSY